MNELLKKLFEAELLTADTKTQLEEAFDSQMRDLISETKKTTEDAVRLELAEQWVETRTNLIEAMDTKLQEMIAEQFTELEGDISSFRDLEIEYAEKLNEAKAEMATQAQADIAELVEKLDGFLSECIANEFEELKADLMEAKKVQFGRTMFETFAATYQEKFVDQSEVARQLEEAQAALAATTAKLNEATATKLKVERTLKLEGLLSPLNGTPRQLMETILSKVETKDLDKAYAKFIGRVLKEDTNTPAGKEDTVLSEGDNGGSAATGALKTGDLVVESQNQKPTESALSDDEKRRLQRQAGIID